MPTVICYMTAVVHPTFTSPTMNCEHCGEKSRGLVHVQHQVCGNTCAQRIGDESRRVYTASKERPLPPGLYVQGDKPNQWYRAKQWQEEAWHYGWDQASHAPSRSYWTDTTFRDGGITYTLLMAENNQFKMVNTTTGMTRMMWEQPEVPMPPDHNGPTK